MAPEPGSLLLAQFARAPEAGAVKTRLIPALGAEGAADLHARMLLHTCEQLLALDAATVELWYTGDAAQAALTHCAGRGARLRPQVEGDLGTRMAHCAEQALASHDAVVLVGSDIPALDVAYLEQARATLSQYDAVLGPARDGGYVLLGLRRFDPRLFEEVAWGGPQVLVQTEERLAEAGFSWERLAPLRDIDRPQDLQWLPPDLAATIQASATDS